MFDFIHRRLLERFGQLKQSLGPITRVKRQQSESIVKLVYLYYIKN